MDHKSLSTAVVYLWFNIGDNVYPWSVKPYAGSSLVSFHMHHFLSSISIASCSLVFEQCGFSLFTAEYVIV